MGDIDGNSSVTLWHAGNKKIPRDADMNRKNTCKFGMFIAILDYWRMIHEIHY